MLFSDALAALNKGQYVTRTGWNDGSYLILLPGMPYLWKVQTQPAPAAGNWLPMNVDLLADDWQAINGQAPVIVQADATPNAA
jgi:hypothetical protein